MSELSELLTDDRVIDCIPNPDGSTLVFTENNDGENPVDAFADRTESYSVTSIEYTETPGQTAHLIS